MRIRLRMRLKSCSLHNDTQHRPGISGGGAPRQVLSLDDNLGATYGKIMESKSSASAGANAGMADNANSGASALEKVSKMIGRFLPRAEGSGIQSHSTATGLDTETTGIRPEVGMHKAGVDNGYRIQRNDTYVEALGKMSDGIPGSFSVLLGLSSESEKRGGNDFEPLLALDSAGIYGSGIWMLCKDVCNQDYGKTLDVLNAWKAGDITRKQLHYAIQNRGQGLTDGRGEAGSDMAALRNGLRKGGSEGEVRKSGEGVVR